MLHVVDLPLHWLLGAPANDVGAPSMSALDLEARGRRLSLAFAARVGEATPAPDVLRIDQSARLLGAARGRDALIARVRELEAALREALDGWESEDPGTPNIAPLRALLGGG